MNGIDEGHGRKRSGFRVAGILCSLVGLAFLGLGGFIFVSTFGGSEPWKYLLCLFFGIFFWGCGIVLLPLGYRGATVHCAGQPSLPHFLRVKDRKKRGGSGGGRGVCETSALGGACGRSQGEGVAKSLRETVYYKIVKRFGPGDGEMWREYLKWRGLELTRFDSVDGILRPSMFVPKTGRDWKNCVEEDYMIHLITSLAYAKSILSRYEGATIVGVELDVERDYVPAAGLLGYDIIDGYCDVSLVTNFGTGEDCAAFNDEVMENGLIGDLACALRVRDALRAEWPGDSHARDCGVWAVYGVEE